MNQYSPDIELLALDIMQHARENVHLPSDALRGNRFNDDQAVLARMKMMFAEDDFLRDPCDTVDLALIDRARSDYWYAEEKDYEDEQGIEAAGC